MAKSYLRRREGFQFTFDDEGYFHQIEIYAEQPKERISLDKYPDMEGAERAHNYGLVRWGPWQKAP